MMDVHRTAQEIRDIIFLLIKESLVDAYNAPTIVNVGSMTKIGISNAPVLSGSMKNIPYAEAFSSIFEAGAYNMIMLDGALIQILYSFTRRTVVSHRLCYFPSPNLASYDEAAELYRDDEIFADIFSFSNVRVPIRFDFNHAAAKHVDIDHPKSHMTIGQYDGCRIPVDGPVTPQRFMRFILRNFYNSVYPIVDIDRKAELTSFPSCITARERTILHINA